MAQLAVKGHSSHGKDVIEILEMLGGNNTDKCWGVFPNRMYVIDDSGNIGDIDSAHEHSPNYQVYTLEQFLEKFPYKVGDKVRNARINELVGEIINARWDYSENQIIYVVEWDDTTKSTLTYFAKGLQPYKEENMEERGEKSVDHVFEADVISFDIAQRDKYELDLQGKFEVVLREGKYYVERIKPKYPNTYEECCKILQVTHTEWQGYLGEVLVPFQKLLICRNAYWVIAGGLKPDWKKADERKYCIVNTEWNITNWVQKTTNKILAFPTEEMRDAFYENFKELIETCKEFL